MCLLCGNPGHIPASSDEAEPISGPISDAAPVYNLNQVIAQLRTSWGGSSENSTFPFLGSTIYYAALSSAPLDSSPENSGWLAMSPTMVTHANEAFELWDDLIPVSMSPY